MPDSDPTARLRRYLDAVNAGDYEALADAIGPGFDHHSGAGDLDLDGVRRGLECYSGSGPTHRTIASPGLSLHRTVDGRIVEDWEYGDDLAVLQDLGFRIEPPDDAYATAAG